jgi:hypothetical protein
MVGDVDYAVQIVKALWQSINRTAQPQVCSSGLKNKPVEACVLADYTIPV